ncbi:helix-turn-helix domain-containing protein [Streptomyces sp. NPDC058471]|uniref:helix-turn-helix domain-containing protein n=1 Tax=Streptomyces sp. NPDC058471 TaxID=3346516 RepID=UPI00364E93C2
MPYAPREGAKLPSPAHPRPTVRRRKVGGELRRLREAAGVKAEEAAERIGGDKSKISRQENGRQGISKLEMEALLDLYRVEDPKVRTALITMAREGRRKGWWAQYGDVLPVGFQERLAIESDAVRILAFQPLLVPGLLQTKSYAEVLIRGVEKDASEADRETLMAVRMSRQEILKGDDAPQYVCVLDEAVLRREIGGPKVMAEQLEQLLEISNPPRLTIQVIPFSEGWHAGLDGPFSVYTYPDPMDLDVVNLDYLDGALYLEEDGPVGRYQLAFDEIRAAAPSHRKSMDLITQAVREFKKRI